MRHLKVELRAPSRETALALVGLLALALFHSREAVFEGRAFFVRDLHLQWYGQVESFVGAIAAGSWPLWDPYVSFGQPMLANANTEILYPLTWLNLLMRPWAYYTLFFLFHLVVAGMGVRALGRRLGLSATGAWLAGSAWVSAGPFLSLGNAWNHLAAAAWMPWALLAAERAFDAPTLRSSVIWGGALALLILAGSPDFLAMTALATLALFVARLDWRRLASRAHGRLLGVGLGAVLLASGLAAGQVLPSLDVAERSDRFRLSEEERTYWSVHPASLLETALPVFWDDLPLSATWRAALYESREPYLISLYIGAPLLALAAAGLVSPASRRRGALGAVAAICSLVSLGRHAPFYGMAMALFPPLKVVRFPAKALVLASLMAVLLAAMGWEAWRQGDAARRQRPRRALGLALFLLTTSCLGLSFFLRHLAEAASWRLLGAATCGAIGLLLLRLRESRARSAALAGGAMAALVVLPLALVHRNLNPTAPRELFTARPAVLDAVHQDDRRRLFVYDYLAARGRSQRYLKREVPYIVPAAKREPRSLWLGALGMRMYLLPPVPAAFRVYDSYGRDALGIQPTPLAELNAFLAYAEGTPLFLRALRLGAVSQVLTLHEDGLQDLTPVRSFHGPFFEDERLFSVPGALPRVFLAGGARVSANGFEVLEDPAFDPAREVILAEGVPHAAPPGFSGDARVLEMRPDRLVVETEANASSHLVFVDAYDPGWHATLDGGPAPVLRANLAFRAVSVPAGRHRVEMRYLPRSVEIGLGLSALSVVLGLALLARAPRERSE